MAITKDEVHQRLTDEVHLPLDPWEITPLCSDPERVRAVGAVYWEGRMVGGDGAVLDLIRYALSGSLILGA